MAKTIPNDEKVFMVSKSTNTIYSGSAALKAMNDWYTMEDVSNTVRPYKVFTALLTQSGGDNLQTVYIGTDYGPDKLTIGVTYTITGNDTTDFTNVGAPNNDVGTIFIATGTNPANQNENDVTYLDYNTGAPVATVLENTIGNVWFTYHSAGQYFCYSDGLFINPKSTIMLGNVTWDGGSGIIKSGFDGEVGLIITSDYNNESADNYAIFNTPIEIRVYN